MIIGVGVAPDQAVVHELVGHLDTIQDLAAVAKVAGVGEGTEGDKACDREGLFHEAMAGKLSVELFELFHGGAFLEKRVEVLVGERFEFW